ncbi:LIM domain-containing protein WLIM1 [Capsicum baccatum]|uniref:LIM domain-containing protein WLIM1 n=1 Tax=Capsicum baccatum TaxID=33114 RepID=A0A2G2X0N3_CAPBA|nr:LIM domain-containing protein WLIM1 [Capsicum baccatum]
MSVPPSSGDTVSDHTLISSSNKLAVWTKALKVEDNMDNSNFQVTFCKKQKFTDNSNITTGTPKIVKPQKHIDNEKPQVAKVTSMFGGTREKCFGCKNTVYPTEKVSVNGTPYHKSCFKCSHGGCVISPSNYIAHEGRLYCKHHHIQLIKEKGNLSKLEGDHEMNPAMTTQVTAES